MFDLISSEFDVEKYIDIENFENICKINEIDTVLLASFIGCIEGIIQISKSSFTCLGLYNIECNKYIFLNLYNYIKANSSFCNFIIEYFNLWHSKMYEEFSYDEYHMRDLINNCYNLQTLIQNEMDLALKFGDNDTYDKYYNYYNILTYMFRNYLDYAYAGIDNCYVS